MDRSKFYFLCVLCASLIMEGCFYKRDYETPSFFEEIQEKVKQVDVIELSDKKEVEVKVENKETDLPEHSLSIEECIAFALKNNLDLQVELINPSIEKENVIQAEASEFEPSFQSMTRYSMTDTPSASSLEGSKVDDSNINLGVYLPLATGGEFSVELSDQRYKTNSIYYSSTLNPSYTTGLSATISQPLLRNRGNRIKSYNIRLAQYQSTIVDAQTKKRMIEIIADVGNKYWQLYSARKNLDVRRQDFELKKALFEQSKRFVEVGEKARIELVDTKAGMARSSVDLINAENDLRDRERELKLVLNNKGLGMETNTVLIPSTSPDLAQYDLDKEKIIKNALENRMDMLELEINLVKDESKIEYLKNQALPTANLQYTYKISGLGSDRIDSYDILSEADYNNSIFNLNITIPLGNKRARSELRRAVYERSKRLVLKEKKEADIKNEVLKNIDKVESSWQGIHASKESTMYQEEAYKEKKRRYELGIETAVDLLQAQQRLIEAQKSEVDAITSYQTALIELAKSEGKFFSAEKVEWVPVVPKE